MKSYFEKAFCLQLLSALEDEVGCSDKQEALDMNATSPQKD